MQPNIRIAKRRQGGMTIMGEAIGTIIFVIIALVAVAVVGSIVLSLLGFVLGLVPLLIKLAVWGGLIYLGWLVFRKLSEKKTAD
jgi:threonine/homoserine/homoserine lactone efflux protein